LKNCDAKRHIPFSLRNHKTMKSKKVDDIATCHPLTVEHTAWMLEHYPFIWKTVFRDTEGEFKKRISSTPNRTALVHWEAPAKVFECWVGTLDVKEFFAAFHGSYAGLSKEVLEHFCKEFPGMFVPEPLVSIDEE
jgi:hypothetical protein